MVFFFFFNNFFITPTLHKGNMLKSASASQLVKNINYYYFSDNVVLPFYDNDYSSSLNIPLCILFILQ